VRAELRGRRVRGTFLHAPQRGGVEVLADAVIGVDAEGRIESIGTGEADVELPAGMLEQIDHIDLLIVKKGEQVQVEVPVHVTGDPISGSVAVVEHATLHIAGEATHLPEVIEIPVAGLGAGTHVAAGSIALPAGVTLLTDAGQTIVSITASVSP